MLSFKRVCVIIVFLACSSCTHKSEPIAYQCPPILLPPDPKAAVLKLTVKSSPDEVIKAWVATAVAYRDWNRIVKKQVNASK